MSKAKSNDKSHINIETSKFINDTSKTETTQSSTSVGWSGAHVPFYQSEEIRKWILLDNGSNANLFWIPSLVKNKNKTVLELSTNSGDIVTDKKATVPGYGEVWYKPEAITNIFSFTEMEDKYRITYDSSIEKAFVVHLPHKKVKFMRHNGLYYHIPTYNTLKSKQTSLLLNHSSQTTKMHSIRERSI